MEASFTVKDLLMLTLRISALAIYPVVVVYAEIQNGSVEWEDLSAIPLAVFCLAGIVYLWVAAYRKAGEWR